MITEAKRKEMADARVALHMIFDAVQHIAGQGNAFRRKNESTGNFFRLLDKYEKLVPELKRFRSHSASYTYTSPDIQNEIIEMLAHAVVTKIFREVRAATFFSIIMDETTDINRRQQAAVCFRYTTEI